MYGVAPFNIRCNAVAYPFHLRYTPVTHPGKASVVAVGGRAGSPLRAETTFWVRGGVQRTARPTRGD